MGLFVIILAVIGITVYAISIEDNKERQTKRAISDAAESIREKLRVLQPKRNY